MATETVQVPAPAMPAVAERAAATGGGNSSRAGAGLPPPPRRGQIKEKILKDVVAAVAAMAAGLVKNSRADGGEEGLLASDDAGNK